MIDFLLGVPGKLKSISDYLTTYWTTARAAKLDYLTANVAVASTAVSNADYTSARAAKLDNILAGVVKSVQTGLNNSILSSGGAIGTYFDITGLTAVNISKTVVFLQMGETNTSLYGMTGYMVSTTTLRIESNAPPGSFQPRVRYYVVEFY